MIGTLFDPAHDALSPYNPATFVLDPSDPVARSAKDGMVEDFYPVQLELNLDAAGGLQRLFDHITTGAYTGLILGDDGLENRIQPLHWAFLGEETRRNLEAIHATHGSTPSQDILFHLPDMMGVHHMTRSSSTSACRACRASRSPPGCAPPALHREPIVWSSATSIVRIGAHAIPILHMVEAIDDL